MKYPYHKLRTQLEMLQSLVVSDSLSTLNES